MNGKSLRIGVVAIFLLIVAAIGLVAANPHGCPPGQGQCKLVQHNQTGKTKCMPEQAVAWPWEVIDDPNGICSTVDPATPTAKPVDPTAEPDPTDMPDDPPVGNPTVAPTSTPRATATPVTPVSPTAEPTDPATRFLPTCTQTPTFSQPVAGEDCDICLELRRQADALERIASAQETQAAKP